jgi:nucleoside-diphosphate-sugar epimerase
VLSCYEDDSSRQVLLSFINSPLSDTASTIKVDNQGEVHKPLMVMPALTPNSLIAITGISGYIASHIGLCVLRGGLRVRGIVRSKARAESLKAGYEKEGIPAADLNNRLEFVIVDDLNSEEQWTAALKGVDGVVHTALNLEKLRDPEIVDEAIEGTLSLLRAAKKHPSIKRVVLTSSIAAMITPPLMRDRVLTADDWNDEAVEIVKKGPSAAQNLDPRLKRAYPCFFYSAAKTQAERAAWEFAKQVSLINPKSHHLTEQTII